MLSFKEFRNDSLNESAHPVPGLSKWEKIGKTSKGSRKSMYTHKYDPSTKEHRSMYYSKYTLHPKGNEFEVHHFDGLKGGFQTHEATRIGTAKTAHEGVALARKHYDENHHD